MSELRRLIDDPETPEGAREGLREAAETEPYDVDAGLRRLKAVIAAGSVAAAGGTAAAATATTSAAKIGLAVVLAGALAGGGAVAYQNWSEEPAAAPRPSEGPGSDAPAERAPAARAPAALPGSEPPPATEPSAATSAPNPVEPERTSEPAARSAAELPRALPSVDRPGRPEATPTDALRAETLHLARVRSALERSPREALRLAREGQERFAGGVFEEERQALLVMALERSGQPRRARREARAFVERYPNGPLTARVREIAEAD